MKAPVLFLTLLLLAGAGRGFAQKIAVKHDLATVDRQPYARIESDGSGLLLLGQRTFYVSSPQGERLLAVKEQYYNDPTVATPDNPTGTVRYVQLLFPTGAVAELPISSLGFERPLDIARTLYVARLLRGPALDAQAVADFAAIHGTPFTTRRQVLDQALLARPLGY